MVSVQYLTFDSIQEGVGASQVLSYLEELHHSWPIQLISLEKSVPNAEFYKYYKTFNWIPLPFGKNGLPGGLLRLLNLRKYVNKEVVIHARGDFATFAAILAGASKVIWDCRAITPDQRISSKQKSRVSFEYLLLRIVEFICAKKASKIIVITSSAKEFLKMRYRIPDSRFLHVSTCVNLNRFKPVTNLMNDPEDTLKVAFIGTLGDHYDLNLISLLIASLRKLTKVHFTLALDVNGTNNHHKLPYDSIVRIPHRSMPEFINSQDIGLSIWRENMGVSLKSVAATKNAEFLACGKPIVVNLNQGDVGKIVLKNNVGVVTSSADKTSIELYSKSILDLLSEGKQLASRCRNTAEDHYSLDKGIRSISRLYASLM